MAVAGRIGSRGYDRGVGSDAAQKQKCRGPQMRAPTYMCEDSVTVGRAGRLSVHTLDERARGMRETDILSTCSVFIGHGECLLE